MSSGNQSAGDLESVDGLESVDYVETFIAAAEDCPVEAGMEPPRQLGRPSIAARTYEMIAAQPYRFTSADVLFGVFADRMGIAAGQRAAARAAFFARSQACLRASDLGRRYGWGLHADAAGRVALYGRESPEYAALLAGERPQGAEGAGPVRVVRAMRRARAGGTAAGRAG